VSRSRAELAQFIEAQRVDYLRGLPERMAQIDACWAEARQAVEPREQLLVLERLGHGLYGTAGTFGFLGLSEAGHELEGAAEALAQAAGDDQAARRRVADAVEQVRRSLPTA
jgi:HPt (histidine-containing phosphotransfer) domain-containing protein